MEYNLAEYVINHNNERIKKNIRIKMLTEIAFDQSVIHLFLNI